MKIPIISFPKITFQNTGRKLKIVGFVLITAVITLMIAGGLLWFFRARLFSFLANSYIESVNKPSDNKTNTEKIIETNTIFTQEHFIVDTVKKTNPAVVAITISKTVPKYDTYIDNTNPLAICSAICSRDLIFKYRCKNRMGLRKRISAEDRDFLFRLMA